MAAVFAVHPLHVESVAWITERKDVLSGLFGILASGAYVWYARGPSVLRYLLVAAALALGLMAKPMLVTWPLVFLLLDYWPLGVGRKSVSWERGASRCPRRPLSRSGWKKMPLLLLVAVFAALHVPGPAVRGYGRSPWNPCRSPQRIARAAVLYVAYLGKTLWPVNLAAVYPDAPMESYWPAVGAGALLALLTAGALWGAGAGSGGWPWAGSGIWARWRRRSVWSRSVSQVMADRFLYLPQIGICLALVWGGAHLAGSWPFVVGPWRSSRRWLLAGLMACAWQQTSYWQNSETLWTHTLACTRRFRSPTTTWASSWPTADSSTRPSPITARPWKSSPTTRAHINLGIALAARGQFDEAIAHYRKALEIKPDYAEAHDNLGLALAGRGQVDEAIAHYRKALEIEPDYADAHYNLGIALADRGQIDEAIAHYRKALEIKPDYAEAHNNLGTPWPAAGRSTRPSPITARPWKSSPTTPRPTTTWATPWPAADSSTRPSPITARPWKSSPTTPMPTSYLAMSWPTTKTRRGPGHFRKALDLASARTTPCGRRHLGPINRQQTLSPCGQRGRKSRREGVEKPAAPITSPRAKSGQLKGWGQPPTANAASPSRRRRSLSGRRRRSTPIEPAKAKRPACRLAP